MQPVEETRIKKANIRADLKGEIDSSTWELGV